MYTYLAALFSFSFVLGIGILFRFVCVDCFWLIPLFSIYLSFLRYAYHKANCISLELSDFAYALVFSFLGSFLIQKFVHPIDVHVFSFLYLCSLVGVVQFASSIRFKTLIKN